MHYTGEIYRPPNEANTPLLEVTTGCSWNKCKFCNMYSKPFELSPVNNIEEDLQELQEYYPEGIERIFLVNGDAFVYSRKKLLKISQLVHKYFPDIKTITTYASLRNLKNKTSEDLTELKNAGYDELYIGLETAYDPALKFMHKGYTSADEYKQLEKLEDSEIRYNALLMPGIAGHGKYKENAEATSKLLNRYKPHIIWYTATSVIPDTELYDLRNEGKFEEVTEREMIEEELLFLKKLDLDGDSIFYGNHPYNLIPVDDTLDNKDKMIEHIEKRMEYLDKTKPGLLDSKFNTHPSKRNNYKKF